MSSSTKLNNGETRGATAGRGVALAEYDVAIIGAGPYGLSAGVHLRAKGFGVRVFGEPMDFWATKMPHGMLLRSPRVASNLSDPDHAFTLDAYESASGIPPSTPLPRETFVEYGRWFRHQLADKLDRRSVTKVERESSGFRVVLEDGEAIRFKRVVVAAGIGPFQRKPVIFANLSASLASHCYEGRDLRDFRGKRVAVIGAGQSALESAALLAEAGAEVEVLAKNSSIRWIGMHSWLHHLGPISSLLYSQHDVGPAGISRLVAYPHLMYRVPLRLKDKIRKRAVRPAGSRWLPARLTKVKLTTARYVTKAEPQNEAIILKLDDGSERNVDHVLLGTGYDVDISRYDFLPSEIVQNTRMMNGYPCLTRGFRSSVPGLHFIGATAARSFGPLLYFVAGTEFASRELTRHISRNRVVAR
ncbi:MAG TPA: NAD(P)-binding domain-containing protein [Terriglobales bacterium]|nr:NAD(P)-binding domain-containing protein [Terriglobales bacterium]